MECLRLRKDMDFAQQTIVAFKDSLRLTYSDL
jgi:hypothetical protein